MIVADAVLAQLKTNSTIFKGVVLEEEADFIREASKVYSMCSNTIVVNPSDATTKSLPIEHLDVEISSKCLINDFMNELVLSNQGTVSSLVRFLTNKANSEGENYTNHVESVDMQEMERLLTAHYNSMLVFDWDVLEECLDDINRYYSFLDGLRKKSHEKGEFVIIVSEKPKAALESKLGFLLVSNIIFFLSNGKEIRINGKWIHPYEKLEQTVEMVRKRMIAEQAILGGEIIE